MTWSETVVVIGIDAGHHDRAACEHQARDLADDLGGATFISTHIVTEPEPHYAAVIEARVSSELARRELADVIETGHVVIANQREDIDITHRAGEVAFAHRSRQSGRVILFPGQESLLGVVPLTDITTQTAVEELVCLGESPGESATLRTQDFVRPEFTAGRLVLVIQPFDGINEFVPFEQPNPHPCCANH
jgi:hypothetical protein